MPPSGAIPREREDRTRIGAGDRDRFIQTVEELLLELNERNIARFKVRPSEFQSWWQVWQGR